MFVILIILVVLHNFNNFNYFKLYKNKIQTFIEQIDPLKLKILPRIWYIYILSMFSKMIKICKVTKNI